LDARRRILVNFPLFYGFFMVIEAGRDAKWKAEEKVQTEANWSKFVLYVLIFSEVSD